MRLDEISEELRKIAFEYFYWHSRFEFALKEKYWKLSVPGSRAEPNWNAFVADFSNKYALTEAGRLLLAENPKRQVIGLHGLDFKEVGFDDRPTDLGMVVRLLNTVRNNLFHGGKYEAEGWDNPLRTRRLLSLSVTVLGELSELGDMGADYKRYY